MANFICNRKLKGNIECNIPVFKGFGQMACVRNRPATEPVMLKVHNVKLSFDIWLILYMYFILYS